MKFRFRLITCLLCSLFVLPHKGLSQEPFPRIEIAVINREMRINTDKDILRYGVQSFGNGVYRDSLVNHLDTIRPVENYENRYENHIYQAIWGSDTLTYRVRPAQFRTHTFDYEAKKKREALEVESQIPPFHRFTAVIEGLDDAAIAALTDSMSRMKADDAPLLFNNCQTCIFYALEALFETHQICTAPIITRNSNFEEMRELNAFFDRFLTVNTIYPCRFKDLKDKTFPNNSLLAFIDDNGLIMHAVFYRDGTFHSKNGMHPPIEVPSLKSIMQAYGRWDSKKSGLSKEGKAMLAHELMVYTVNEDLFF
ncbi:hypothetical protein [Parabacteroides sp. PF5-6]|uniref:hypothetical protein n=1 Tax=Parabacteroides sp. PF5-6 TaxID=1742403 RepID=UPI0024052DB5|nr:hypothetical protein [Parabacteroides sp. PF5-6]MDF9829657.1 hypothetical protein [Parabacteroides sp. PF5-6]